MDSSPQILDVKGIITVDQDSENFPLLGKDQIPLARIEFPGDECKPLVTYLDITGVALITREISLAEATVLGIHHDRLGEQIGILGRTE